MICRGKHVRAENIAMAEPKEGDLTKTIFETAAAEATGFYQLVITVATAFLGGTLVFYEKIAPQPSKPSLVLAGLGWLLLVICIWLIARIRLLNMESAHLALRGDFKSAQAIDHRTRAGSRNSVTLLVLGMMLVIAAGIASLWVKAGTPPTPTPPPSTLPVKP